MAINKAFTILTRKQGTLRHVSDCFQEEHLLKSIHNALVPANGTSPFIDYAAEQLIQCVRHSSVKTQLDLFDEQSKYQYPLAFPSLFEYSMIGDISTSITVSYMSEGDYNKDLEQSCNMEIDADAKIITFTGGNKAGTSEAFTVTDNLSSVINISDKVAIRIRYPMTGSHSVELNYILPFTRTLLDIKNELPALALARYDYIKEEQLPDYISGIVMDVCFRQERTDG